MRFRPQGPRHERPEIAGRWRRDEFAAWVAASRAEQGLPPTVEDPEVLDLIARIIVADERPEGDD